jgi:hypothetical protein
LSALFSNEDLEAILGSVQRFCESSVQPACERPERPMTPAQLSALRIEAESIGLLNASPEPAFGLWEHAEDSSARLLSVRMLSQIAEVNAGVAFHLHSLALARFVARSLSLHCPPETVISMQGAWGLGRGALARCLRGATLDADERLLLADYFGCDGPRDLLLQAADEWQHVLLPSFDADQQTLWFGIFSRNSLQHAALVNSHGLDETSTYALLRRPHVLPMEGATPEPEQARELFAAALCLHALALITIGTGALAQAYASARTYAGMRAQGGKKIDQHPAVQELLGSAYAARAAARAMIEGLAALAPGRASLLQMFAARAEAHPRLCAGSNDALQVFGGLGYMRDAGLEKIVRDQNCLRVLFGTPGELRRFIAEWERP